MKKIATAPPAAQSDREAVRSLRTLMNVGPSIAADLLRIGIRSPSALAGKDSEALYDELCRVDGHRHDPCLYDVLESAVDQADGLPARPWWSYTPARKARIRSKGPS